MDYSPADVSKRDDATGDTRTGTGAMSDWRQMTPEELRRYDEAVFVTVMMTAGGFHGWGHGRATSL